MMSKPLGPPAPLWPSGNPLLLPQRLQYSRSCDVLRGSTDGKISVVDLTEDREMSPDERGENILLQGYVMRAAQLGMLGDRS